MSSLRCRDPAAADAPAGDVAASTASFHKTNQLSNLTRFFAIGGTNLMKRGNHHMRIRTCNPEDLWKAEQSRHTITPRWQKFVLSQVPRRVPWSVHPRLPCTVTEPQHVGSLARATACVALSHALPALGLGGQQDSAEQPGGATPHHSAVNVRRARRRYVTFRPDFHHFDRLELEFRGHLHVRGAAFSCLRLKSADTVLI